MFTRPYTVIFRESLSHAIVSKDVFANSDTKRVKVEIEKRYPGKEVLALVCGTHTAGTTTFQSSAQYTHSDRRIIDPFVSDIFDA